MRYMGGKSRHAKEIFSVILNLADCRTWVEPFVGGASVLNTVPQNIPRLARDINHDLIELYKAVQAGTYTPPDEVTLDDYTAAKNVGGPSAHRGFVGVACSYGGKWFGGYARGLKPNGEPRNFCGESKQALMARNFNGVDFSAGSYQDLVIPVGSTIYCDPPYAGTTGYKNKFDTSAFWVWCEARVRDGHNVFVSEYTAPDGWACVWEKNVNSSLTKDTGAKKNVERLFTKFPHHAQ